MLETSAGFSQTISQGDGHVTLSEVISALTFALDFTDGAVAGHSLRTCLLGMRLAEALGVPAHDLTSLYYALLLKDIGCADSGLRYSEIMAADDRGPWSLSGWSAELGASPVVLEKIWREVLPGIPLPGRIGRMVSSISEQPCENSRERQTARLIRTMHHLGMGEETIRAIANVDARWDGSGDPAGLAGSAIPLLAQICSVAQTLDAFATEHGQETALRMLRSRRGTWFSPELVRAAQTLHTSGKLWNFCQPSDVENTRAEVMRQDPGHSAPIPPDRVDRICEAFGTVVDAKSPFTFHHSIGVTDVAISIAEELALPAERISLIRRAAFLHDIGKLAVPNRILDKRSRLTPAEWVIITRHPMLSAAILRRVSAFRELAILAGEHHERLDGSGYPFRLESRHLSLESRVIAIADCYAAMAEDRPYRPGLDTPHILETLSADIPGKLDPVCYEALVAAANRWGGNMPQTIPAGPIAKKPPRSSPYTIPLKRPLLAVC